jgi:adenylate cyclase
MLEIIFALTKVFAVIAVLVISAFTGRYIAGKYGKNELLYFIIGLIAGPAGLLLILVIIRIPEKLIGPFITFTVFIIITISFTQTTLLSGLEWGAIDFRFYVRDPSQKSIKIDEGVRMNKINPRASRDIVILGIDESTVREFSDQGIHWPFPWELHAKFTNFISTGNPAAILFDIMFLDHKKGEKELIEAIKKSGVTFIDYPFENEEIDIAYNDQDERLELLNNVRFPLDPDDDMPQIVAEVVPPTPDLIRASAGIGFANVFPGRDGINRTVPLIVKYDGWYYPNIDLIVAMHYYGIGPEDVEIKIGKYIKLKNLNEEKMARPDSSREIIIPIDKYGFMDVNFIGGSGSFQHYPYYLFARDGTMEGNDSLKGKVLLVAAYSVTGVATDEKQSPYGATFGIEHHANALNTILQQDFLYKLSDFENIMVMFFIALFLAFIVQKMTIVTSLVTTVFFMFLYSLGSYLLFDFYSIITALSTPLIQTALTYTMLVTYRVVNEQQEKKYIRQTFSKFVSKSVVDELLKDPSKVKLGGEKKILTVLFSDIRGFTSISERLTPEELVEHLNVYLQSMTDIVIKYYGTLDKYVGDEIMAFWGAPVEMEDHALKACHAAIEMMEELHKMNKNWEMAGKPTLDIGIGINTGDMVVGNMGSASRMDYTLMGDNVNLGARLEGTNKVYHTHIIISEFTYEYVKNHVVARELDLIRVKGKALPVKIYELVAIK